MAFLRRINHTSATELPLDRKELTIGRDASNDVSVDKYDGISRNHCGFTKYEDGVITVTDFGSRNGTFVNGKQIFSETPLKHGDKIRVCQEVQFVFVDYDSPQGKAELAAEEKAKAEVEAKKKNKVVVEGDSEMSDAMTELKAEMSKGKDFKSLMSEIIKDTRPKSPKFGPPKKEPPAGESVNQYEEFKVKRRHYGKKSK